MIKSMVESARGIRQDCRDNPSIDPVFVRFEVRGVLYLAAAFLKITGHSSRLFISWLLP